MKAELGGQEPLSEATFRRLGDELANCCETDDGQSLSPGRAVPPTGRMTDPLRGWLMPLLVALGAYGVAIAGAHALLNDGDTLSHIAIGRWIIAHRALPFRDPFSFTAHGEAWVPHEWLAEVVFALVYNRLGWGGIVTLTGLACAAAFGILAHALARNLGWRHAMLATLAGFSLVEAHYLARPHALAWPCLVAWMAGVVGARDRGRLPSLALLPVMTLWCNLHGGFVVGLLFAVLLAVEAVWQTPSAARFCTLRGWGVFVACAGVAALVSPNGVDGLLLPFKMLKMNFALSSISEWRAASFARFDPIEVWIGLLILGGCTLGLKLPVSRVLMVLLLLWMALDHVRNEELLGIIAPLLVAAPLALRLKPLALPRQAPVPGTASRLFRQPHAMRVVGAIAGLTVLMGITVFATVRLLNHSGLAPRAEVAPIEALAAARRAGLDGHVFNSVRFGGYLMFEGIPTFVDGRADLFGDAFLKRYVAATNAFGGLLPDLLDRYAIRWTLLEPQSPAAGLLDHLPGWERLYADAHAVVHRRKSPRS
jgi:hypothetical protein